MTPAEEELKATIEGLQDQKGRLEAINPRTPEEEQELQKVKDWLSTAQAELRRLQQPEQ